MKRRVDPVSILRRRWVTIAVTALLGLIVAAGYSLTVDRQYVSTSRLYVSVQALSGASGDPLQNSQAAQQRLVSYASLATGAAVTDAVGQALEIPTSDLAGRISASYPPGTVLLDIATTADSPQSAQQLTSAVDDALQRLVARIETPTAGGSAAAALTVVDSPSPGTASGTSTTTLLGAGLLAGLVIGMALAYARERLDRTIHDAGHLAELLPIATSGPITLRRNLHSADNPTAVDDAGLLEIRSLRARLQPIGADGVTVLVLGAGGDTWGFARELARSFALSTTRTVIIDAGLVAPDDPAASTRPGLAEVMAGSSDLASVIRTDVAGNLDHVPAGRLDLDASAVLGSTRFAEIVGTLRADHRCVIIDSSSTHGRNPEIPAMAALADAAVVVVEMGAVTADDLMDQVEPLRDPTSTNGSTPRLFTVPVVIGRKSKALRSPNATSPTPAGSPAPSPQHPTPDVETHSRSSVSEADATTESNDPSTGHGTQGTGHRADVEPVERSARTLIGKRVRRT